MPVVRQENTESCSEASFAALSSPGLRPEAQHSCGCRCRPTPGCLSSVLEPSWSWPCSIRSCLTPCLAGRELAAATSCSSELPCKAFLGPWRGSGPQSGASERGAGEGQRKRGRELPGGAVEFRSGRNLEHLRLGSWACLAKQRQRAASPWEGQGGSTQQLFLLLWQPVGGSVLEIASAGQEQAQSVLKASEGCCGGAPSSARALPFHSHWDGCRLHSLQGFSPCLLS